MLEQALETWRAGGFVMPPLLLATLLLWWTLGWRGMALRRGDSRSLRELVTAARRGALEARGIIAAAVLDGVQAQGRRDGRRGRLEVVLGRHRESCNEGRVLVAAIVAVAPLAGLLGTVTGMIVTFDGLGNMALFSRNGGIAGGVAQALVSTQMGLAVAIPGVIAGRILDGRQESLETELDELTELLAAEVGP